MPINVLASLIDARKSNTIFYVYYVKLFFCTVLFFHAKTFAYFITFLFILDLSDTNKVISSQGVFAKLYHAWSANARRSHLPTPHAPGLLAGLGKRVNVNTHTVGGLMITDFGGRNVMPQGRRNRGGDVGPRAPPTMKLG